MLKEHNRDKILKFCCTDTRLPVFVLVMMLIGAGPVFPGQNAADDAEPSAAATIEQLEKWAATGNTIAPYKLGLMYIEALSIERDYSAAFEWMQTAAAYGNFNAEYNLGLMYLEGIGVRQDHKKAFQWMHCAAYDGSREAQYCLAWMYQTGTGCEQDRAEAVDWYLWLGQSGLDWEPFALAIVYFGAKGQSPNPAMKACHMQQALANCVIAGHDGLDTVLLKQIILSEIPPDRQQQAISYADRVFEQKRPLLHLVQSAKAGEPEAQYKLGRLYERGQGVEKDFITALRWYAKAAHQKREAARNRLQSPPENKKSESDIMAGIFEEAQQGQAAAQWRLGCRYYPDQPQEALVWLNAAAAHEFAPALYSLATIYDQGVAVEKDPAAAFTWYLKAAEQGFEMAQEVVAKKYLGGEGTEKDEVQAFRWFSEAAEKGMMYSRYAVARMYCDGQGVAADYEKAYLWLLTTEGFIFDEKESMQRQLEAALDQHQRSEIAEKAAALKARLDNNQREQMKRNKEKSREW